MIALIPQEVIENRIYLIRGHKVMLSIDLARLYDVPVKRLNEQVKRNIRRFPADFMFQLTWKEVQSLRSRFATLENSVVKHNAEIGSIFEAIRQLMAPPPEKSRRIIGFKQE